MEKEKAAQKPAEHLSVPFMKVLSDKEIFKIQQGESYPEKLVLYAMNHTTGVFPYTELIESIKNIDGEIEVHELDSALDLLQSKSLLFAEKREGGYVTITLEGAIIARKIDLSEVPRE